MKFGRTTSLVLAALLALAGLFSDRTMAQPCEPAWHPLESGGQTGVNGSVAALTVYRGELIVGGGFITVGGQTVNNIARWDGSQWHPFESGGYIGLEGFVEALTVWNGDLIAGGGFVTAGGQTVNRIARWDGSQWHPFESGGQIGVDNDVIALEVYNGDLVAGGGFYTAGGKTVNKIARWNGFEWHPLGSDGQIGVRNPGGPDGGAIVFDLSVHGGDLIVAGTFISAGGQNVYGIALWNGSQWHPFESRGVVSGVGWVFAVTIYSDNIVVGGMLGMAVNHIARWDGSHWHPFESGGQIGVGGGLHGTWVYALTVYNGDMVAAGNFTTAGGQTVNYIARWDGSKWHPFDSGGQIGMSEHTTTLIEYDGDLIAGGQFITAGGQTVNRIARWGCDDEPCAPADLNCDGTVGVADLLVLLGSWGECDDCDDCPADLSDDCSVGVADLLILLANWG